MQGLKQGMHSDGTSGLETCHVASLPTVWHDAKTTAEFSASEMSISQTPGSERETDEEDEAGHALLAERRFPLARDIRHANRRLLSCLPKSLSSTLRSTALFLLPSPIGARLSGAVKKPRKQPSPTAYVNSLRGLAAFMVMVYHFTYTVWGDVNYGYGLVRDDEENDIHIVYTSPIRLPFLRLLYTGDPMVSLFFIISGYALSIKPITLMRRARADTQDTSAQSALHTTLTSSVFRRGLRLFLPTVASTFFIIILMHLGFYDNTRAMATFGGETRMMQGAGEVHVSPKSSIPEELWNWYLEMFNMVHFYEWRGVEWAGYDNHLFTIPLEYRCSLILFLTQMATARLSVMMRVAVNFALFVRALWGWARWDMALFFAGALLAEIDVAEIDVAKSSTLASTSTTSQDTTSGLSVSEKADAAHSSGRHKASWYFTLVAGLWFMSYPVEYGGDAPVSKSTAWLLFHTIGDSGFRSAHLVGVVLFLVAISRIPSLRNALNAGWLQYLGDISFSLYLTHGPIQHTFGYAVLGLLWGVEETGIPARPLSSARKASGFGLGLVINGLMATWVADVFMRVVDAPALRLVRSIEELALRL